MCVNHKYYLFYYIMQGKTASLDLVEFVEKHILPKYQDFDKAHSTGHVTRVIRRALELARIVGADINMTYAIAAYHDIGKSGARAVPHVAGSRSGAAAGGKAVEEVFGAYGEQIFCKWILKTMDSTV